MKRKSLKKHLFYRASVTVVLCFFTLNSMAWAQTPTNTLLAVQSRIGSFSAKLGLDFKDFAALAYAACEIREKINSGTLRTRHIQDLNKRLFENRVFIGTEIGEGELETSKRRYRYVTFYLGAEKMPIEARFIKDHENLTHNEQLELAVKDLEDIGQFFLSSLPQIKGVWFVGKKEDTVLSSVLDDLLVSEWEKEHGTLVVFPDLTGKNAFEKTALLALYMGKIKMVLHRIEGQRKWKFRHLATLDIPNGVSGEIETVEVSWTEQVSFGDWFTHDFGGSLQGLVAGAWLLQDNYNGTCFEGYERYAERLVYFLDKYDRSIGFLAIVQGISTVIRENLEITTEWPEGTGELKPLEWAESFKWFVYRITVASENAAVNRAVLTKIMPDMERWVAEFEKARKDIETLITEQTENIGEWAVALEQARQKSEKNELRDRETNKARLEKAIQEKQLADLVIREKGNRGQLTIPVIGRSNPNFTRHISGVDKTDRSYAVKMAEDEARIMHKKNLELGFISTIPRKTVLCHIISDTIVPAAQMNLLKVELEKGTRGDGYMEKIVALPSGNISSDEDFITELEKIKAGVRSNNAGHDVEFVVACPNWEGLVKKIQDKGGQALAFAMEEEGNIVQLEGVILALRTLRTGDLYKLRNVYRIITGLEMKVGSGDSMDEIARLNVFILPVRKIDTSSVKELNDLIAKNILSAL